MKYVVVHHDTMRRAISLAEAYGWRNPKTPDCRYLQRPHLTADMPMSYRNCLPGTVNVHWDKDLRRESSASQCQNDIKNRWDKGLGVDTRNKNANPDASGPAFTGKSRDSMVGNRAKQGAKGCNNGPIRADKPTFTPAAARPSGPRSSRTSHARRRPAAWRTSKDTGPARAWNRHSTASPVA